MIKQEEICFHTITLKDRAWYIKHVEEDYLEACNHTFACSYVWKEKNGVEVAEIANCVVARYASESDLHCSFPIGGTREDKVRAIRILEEYGKQMGKRLRFLPITGKQRLILNEEFHGEFEIISYREYSDYLYHTDTLAELKGKKLSGKRNYIHRFMQNSDWEYEPMTETAIEECWQLELGWLQNKEGTVNENADDIYSKENIDSGCRGIDGMIQAEKLALRNALDHFHELGLIGGVLRLNREVVAFAIGEELNPDTMVVHFEKARTDVVGAFQMINQQFVLHECKEYAYVNREDDVGEPSLRKAKTSYVPYELVIKYGAVQSEFSYATAADEPDIRRIWKEAFGDQDDYISFYMKRRFTEETTLCIRRGGSVVSFVNLLPLTIQCGQDYVDAIYLYAVATDVKYRRNGYASKLIRHVEENYHKPIIVVPASKSLRSFYQRLNFGEYMKGSCQMYRLEDIDCDPIVNYEISNASNAVEYENFRDHYYGQCGYARWDEQAVRYALEENELCGGSCIYVNNEGYILYRIEDDCVKVIEASVTEKGMLRALKMLMLFHKKTQAVYDLQESMIFLDKDHVAGIAGGYFNLILN